MTPIKVSSIGEYIRQQREQAKISLRQLASTAGISNPYLSQIERGLRRPSAEILQQIAKGLRISAEALYVQAGILEDRYPDTGTRAAILADPELLERQKQVLLEIYESFRREANPGAQAAAPVVPPISDLVVDAGGDAAGWVGDSLGADQAPLGESAMPGGEAPVPAKSQKSGPGRGKRPAQRGGASKARGGSQENQASEVPGA